MVPFGRIYNSFRITFDFKFVSEYSVHNSKVITVTQADGTEIVVFSTD